MKSDAWDYTQEWGITILRVAVGRHDRGSAPKVRSDRGKWHGCSQLSERLDNVRQRITFRPTQRLTAFFGPRHTLHHGQPNPHYGSYSF